MDIAPRYRAPIVILLLLVIAAVGLMIWAGQRRIDVFGPTLLARAASGEIWTDVNQEIVILDAQGKLLRRQHPEALGIEPPLLTLSAMGETMLIGGRDGRLHFVTADLHRDGGFNPARTAAGELFNMFHALWDPRAQRVIVSDTGHHRMVAFNADGDLVARAGEGNGAFRFPNGLALHPEGFVLVADTNHHTLHAIDSDLTDAAWKMDYAAGRNDWPAFVTIAPGGQMYVAWLHDHMLLGDVRQHDLRGRLVRELPLPKDAQPIALLARADDVLIADQSDREYVIHRFDHEGHRLGEFGDSQFRAVLDEAFAQRRLATVLRDGSRVAIVALGIVLLLVAFLASRAQAQPILEEAEVAPPADPPAIAPGRLIVLSLLWPGLAQMHLQRRTEGILFMLVGGALLGMLVLSWTVYLRQISDQPTGTPLRLTVFYVLILAAAIGDALRRAPRRDKGAVI